MLRDLIIHNITRKATRSSITVIDQMWTVPKANGVNMMRKRRPPSMALSQRRVAFSRFMEAGRAISPFEDEETSPAACGERAVTAFAMVTG